MVSRGVLHLVPEGSWWDNCKSILVHFRNEISDIAFGSFIPEGNQVFVHTYSVQRDPRYFSLPNTFWPDRWIPAAERKSPEDATIDKDHVVHNLAAFIPFSSGPANCAGKNLALLELRAVICIMVQRFDFQPEKGFVLSSWEEGLEDLFVINRPPLPVVINSRY